MHCKSQTVSKCENCSRPFCTWTELKEHKQSPCEPPAIDQNNSMMPVLNAANPEKIELNELTTESNRSGIMSGRSSQMEYRINQPIAMTTMSPGTQFSSIVHRKHRNNSTFKCDECGRLFVNKKTLSLHRIIHTDERPFECWLCHKMYCFHSFFFNH